MLLLLALVYGCCQLLRHKGLLEIIQAAVASAQEARVPLLQATR
jgi:hypothetical protein